jgi:hypothetical protein
MIIQKNYTVYTATANTEGTVSWESTLTGDNLFDIKREVTSMEKEGKVCKVIQTQHELIHITTGTLTN